MKLLNLNVLKAFLSSFILFFGISIFATAPKVYAKKPFYGYASWYNSFLSYTNSDVKNWGYATTGYLSLGDGKHNNVEFGGTLTYIKYKKNFSNLNQRDYTLLYSNTDQILKSHIFTLGAHYISSSDKLTDKGYTLIFDSTYYKTEYYIFKWNLGCSLFYSRYHNDNPKFNVIQITPHSTINLTPILKSSAYVYLDLLGYYIHVGKNEELGLNQSNYYSLEGALRIYYLNYYVKLGGWVGKQAFAVKNSGFVVYNLGEVYKGGLNSEIGYTYKKSFYLALSLNIDKYEEIYNNNKNNVIQNALTFSIGKYF